MSPAELADAWESMAEQSIATAENTRSLDLYVREHACAKQLRQCAMQLRMVLGLSRDGTAPKASDAEDDLYAERLRVSELFAVLTEIFTCLKADDPALLDDDQVSEWRERAGIEDL